jgi:glutamyl-tRNA synthetase
MLIALGATPPVYAHVPMILGADGAKLSKRHGAVSVLQYREEGFLPEALLNYLVRLGWSHGDQEVFSMQEMTDYFDIADVNKSASAFNQEKLLWLNQQHMQRASGERLAHYLAPQLTALGIQNLDMARVAAVALVQRERAKTLREMAQNSLFFFQEPAGYDEKAAQKHLTADAKILLAAVHAGFASLKNWLSPDIHAVIERIALEQAVGMGKVAQPIRVAVSGTAVSPPIDATLEILGRDATLTRIGRALAYVASSK